jgi:hypothetical protein
MKKLEFISWLALLVGSSLSSQAIAADPAVTKNAVSGQKIDSGLGDLPHYRHWVDKTGRKVSANRLPGEKLDSGLGEIAPFSLGKNDDSRGVDVAQNQ